MLERNWPSWSTGLRKSAVEIERVVDPSPAKENFAGAGGVLLEEIFDAPADKAAVKVELVINLKTAND